MSSNGNRYEYWLSQHRDRLKSGKTIGEFCRDRRIKEPTYRKAMSRYGFSDPTPSKEVKRGFIELTSSEISQNVVLEIEYKGFQVRLYPNMDGQILRETLEILGGLG